MALGFSEPESGSDVASARTKAVRDGDDWVINGQKMFTTMAHVARWVLLLCRTDPDLPKHRGLTMFLVPLDAPGVAVHPVHTYGGERTNVTFYSDVRVPDSSRVGERGDGWDVLTYSLTSERGSAFGATSMFLGSARQSIDEVAAWARETTRDGRPVIEHRDARRRIARAEIDLEVSRLLNQRSIAVAERGRAPDVEAAQGKLYSTESLQRTCSDLLDLMGEDGLVDHTAPGAPRGGLVEHAYRQSAVTTIYGGSSEVMRNIISQRGLGMPRG
jgi:alkylation response protein AidB-like acyl-CoA dehydrogenase